jgi:hypothetical protein
VNAHPVFVAVSALLKRVVTIDTTGRGELPTLADFTTAMQPAEEIDGPEGASYIALMNEIRDDAAAAWHLVPPDSDAGKLLARVRFEVNGRIHRAAA